MDRQKYILNPVQVLVTSFNRLDYLKLCIESIKSQTHPYILNIWDNGSEPEVKNWIREQKINGIFFDNPTNVGTAKARNWGMDQIDSNYILLSDNDFWYQSDYFEHMIKVWQLLSLEKRLAILSNYHPWEKWYYKRKIIKRKIIINEKYIVHHVSSTPPGSWLVDKRIIVKCGGFWLSPYKKMGFSAFKLTKELNIKGYKFMRLAGINGKVYNGAQHMDYVGHPKCMYSKYSEYNKFRAQQKAISKPHVKIKIGDKVVSRKIIE